MTFYNYLIEFSDVMARLIFVSSLARLQVYLCVLVCVLINSPSY